ncbi:scp1-like small phosphatase 4-related [Anaeramoeba flamelloides]|uniref:Scp1-like small phosphatase 4-related n=1 Tax=Anaeramoeba flamelloides TaxID=1746091 RepID=A0AAV7YB82_9EUKA|nr:scp1-like small phosphatase 4-related [Anaeramoeba flamelloides]KAJ6245178.1 scp1-like small phosphatase 4-related [Anaeramoeba flamelloides]
MSLINKRQFLPDLDFEFFSQDNDSKKRRTIDLNILTHLFRLDDQIETTESENKSQPINKQKTETESDIESETPWFTILDEDEEDSYQPPKLLPFPSLDKEGKITLCLDLDQTLISSSFTENKNYDFSVELSDQGKNWKVFVTKRPYLDEFLQECSQMFEVVVFTASLSYYANSILDYLDPENELISHRLFRESCSNFKDGYLKDLSILGREMDRVAIVDDTPFAYSRNERNAIPAKRFFVQDNNPKFVNWRNDRELLKILQILKKIQHANNVPNVLGKVKKKMHLTKN